MLIKVTHYLRDCLNEFIEGGMSAWQTMDTAPTDGTYVLALSPPDSMDGPTQNDISIATAYVARDGRVSWCDVVECHGLNPTHWMALPGVET